MMAKDTRRPIVTSDGNRTLSVIERMQQHLSDNPADYPTLTAAHIMGGAETDPTDTRVRTHLDSLMSRDLRARAVGAFLFKRLRDSNIVLCYDVYLLGRAGFVQLMKETMRPDSLASGLTDGEFERAYELYEFNMQLLANKGKLRPRKDWRG